MSCASVVPVYNENRVSVGDYRVKVAVIIRITILINKLVLTRVAQSDKRYFHHFIIIYR